MINKTVRIYANATTPSTSFTLTMKQYKNLMTILNGNKSNSMANHVGGASAISDLSSITFCALVFGKEMCWILDTRATDHMVCSANLLSKKSCVTNQPVYLSNKATTTIPHIGSMLNLHYMMCYMFLLSNYI